MARRRPHRRGLVLCGAAVAWAYGCGDSTPVEAPSDPESPHVEVNEMFLRTGEGGTPVSATRMIDEVWVPDTVSLVEGDSLQLRIVFLDFSNAEFTLDDATDHSVRAEVEGPASWVQRGAHGTIRADAPGEARVRFQVWHIDHPDFTSPWLTVSVMDRSP